MNNKIFYGSIALIVLLGSILRLYGLDKSPPSLGFDEAALGYNAYSLMETGRDEYGNLLPISLRSFNDYKPALYSYLTIPFIKLFGLNDISVRMVSAIAGILSLLFLVSILKKYISNKFFLIFIFFILSFEPWRLHFSRNAFETHLSSMFFLGGCYFLLSIKNKVGWWLSLIFYSLSAYSYHSARFSIPILLFFLSLDPIKIILKHKLEINRNKISLLILFLIISIPIFTLNSSSLVLTRFKQENLFSRFYPYSPKEITNIFSSLYYFGGIVSGHVFSNISPINLNFRIYDWVKKSPQFIPGMGMLGWVEGILFIFGLWYAIKNISKRWKIRFLFYWIIAGIVPAAVTWTWFHPLRSLNIYPALEILVALGGWQVYKYFSNQINKIFIKRLILVVISTVLIITITFTINNELLYSAFENHGEYQPGGYKEGMAYLKSIQDNYNQIIIDTPHAQEFIFLLFYQQIDPRLVQSYANIHPKPGVEGNLTFNFEKFIFRKIDWPKDRDLKKTIFWGPNSITRKEVELVEGAKYRKVISNVLYETAVIITTE